MTDDDGLDLPDYDWADSPPEELELDPILERLIDRISPQVAAWVPRRNVRFVVDELFYALRQDLRRGGEVDTPIGRFRAIGRTVLFVPAAETLPAEAP